MVSKHTEAVNHDHFISTAKQLTIVTASFLLLVHRRECSPIPTPRSVLYMHSGKLTRAPSTTGATRPATKSFQRRQKSNSREHTHTHTYIETMLPAPYLSTWFFFVPVVL